MNVMLSRVYQYQTITGWLMSEKLDGVRCLWDGMQLFTRNGSVIRAPEWFTRQLPVTSLDGELFAGYGTLRFMAGTVRRGKPRDADWRRVRFHVFDAQDADAGFEDRLEIASRAVMGCDSVAVPVPHITCTNKAHLIAFRDEICKAGGEGVVLRRPGSAYVDGRSNDYLKCKP